MQKKHAKRGFSLVLAIVVTAALAGGIMPMAQAEGEEDITFTICPSGNLQGMPLFDGDPDHLQAYIDVLWDYVGVEGFAAWATESRNTSNGYYQLSGSGAAMNGRRVPSGHRATDEVGGVSTEFSLMGGQGKTWNTDLLEKIGTVMGNEKLAQSNRNYAYNQIQNFSPVFYTAVADLRINPMVGRFHEGYSEDPHHTARLVSALTGGATGTILPESQDGFWLKNIVGTKHFPNYMGEYNRATANINTSARSLFEYHYKAVLEAVKSNTVNGVMNSFGSTNGIPNLTTPITKYVRSHAKWSYYTSPDYPTLDNLTSTNMSNGYQAYTGASGGPSNGQKQTAIISLTGNAGGGSGLSTDTSTPNNLRNAVVDGVWGVTAEDVKNAAIPQLTNMIRMGQFNERNDYTTTGRPVGYPYLSLTNGVVTGVTNFNNTDSQAVAQQLADETVVLLKNDNDVLPLAKDASVYLLGQMANNRIRPANSTIYSYVVSTPNITNAGLTPYTALQRVSNSAANITLEADRNINGGDVIAIKCANGNYWYAPSGNGGNITTRAIPEDGVFTDNYLFRPYSNGQGITRFVSVVNSRIVTG
ncbi:MAG: hypothetical protein FWE59_05455, partial [Oscillospiraceae bacterium]|nr:hypothetical protein [Oscillospiraceae bacterium]